ncbi:hypothetical protein [Pendulispora albinea]|uniref:Uncharacterized protein n=1 Tax=Pendulispora albinea TaxID=2741071 RepID=A0ABZ2LSW9_9BACT
MTTTYRRQIIVLGALVAAMAIPEQALAWGITPCTVGTEIPFPFRTSYGGSRHWTLPEDVNTMSATKIKNNAYYYHSVAANPAVLGLTFHFSSFDMEWGNDRLQIGTLPPVNLTGALGAFDLYVEDTSSPTTPAIWGASFNLITNNLRPSDGFEIDRVTVSKCRPMPTTPRPYIAHELGDGTSGAGRRTMGILQQTGDVMFYSYLANKNPVPGHFMIHAALNTQIPNVDFNLYARCGAFPTATTHDFKAVAPGGQKFLQFDSGTCSTRWYFAVDSEHGAGQYEFSVATGANINVCATFESGFSREEKDRARDALARSLNSIYGSTAGAVLVSGLQLTDNGECSSSTLPPLPLDPFRWTNIRIDKSCQRSNAAVGHLSPNRAQFCADWMSNVSKGDALSVAYTVVHELGHHIWGLPDEYTDDKGAGCGHSAMAVNAEHSFSFCTAATHRLDHMPGAEYHDPGDLSHSSSPPYGDIVSMWDKMSYNLYGPAVDFPRMRQINTPDNYDYLDYDFNTSSEVVRTVTSYQ